MLLMAMLDSTDFAGRAALKPAGLAIQYTFYSHPKTKHIPYY